MQALAALKGQLNLNTSQQVMWDNAVAQSKAARETGRANFGQCAGRAEPSSRRPSPTSRPSPRRPTSVQAANAALRKQVRSQWLSAVRDVQPGAEGRRAGRARERVARMESFREKMKERRAG